MHGGSSQLSAEQVCTHPTRHRMVGPLTLLTASASGRKQATGGKRLREREQAGTIYQGTSACVPWKQRLVRTCSAPRDPSRRPATQRIPRRVLRRVPAHPLISIDREGHRSGMQRGQDSHVHASVCPRCLSHRRQAGDVSGLLDTTRHKG